MNGRRIEFCSKSRFDNNLSTNQSEEPVFFGRTVEEGNVKGENSIQKPKSSERIDFEGDDSKTIDERLAEISKLAIEEEKVEEEGHFSPIGEICVKLICTYITTNFSLFCAEKLTGKIVDPNNMSPYDDARMVYALVNGVYGGIHGWKNVGPWVSETMGFSGRKVEDKTQVENDQPGFVKKALSQAGNIFAGMMTGGILSHYIIGLFLTVVAHGRDMTTQVPHDPAILDENMRTVVNLGQLLGALCVLVITLLFSRK